MPCQSALHPLCTVCPQGECLFIRLFWHVELVSDTCRCYQRMWQLTKMRHRLFAFVQLCFIRRTCFWARCWARRSGRGWRSAGLRSPAARLSWLAFRLSNLHKGHLTGSLIKAVRNWIRIVWPEAKAAWLRAGRSNMSKCLGRVKEMIQAGTLFNPRLMITDLHQY